MAKTTVKKTVRKSTTSKNAKAVKKTAKAAKKTAKKGKGAKKSSKGKKKSTAPRRTGVAVSTAVDFKSVKPKKVPLSLKMYDKEFQAPPAHRDGNKRGKTTGLVLCHYINELLYANYDKRRTDEEMAAAVKAEFPKRGGIQTMSAYRSYFNAGAHGFGIDGARLKEDERLLVVRPE